MPSKLFPSATVALLLLAGLWHSSTGAAASEGTLASFLRLQLSDSLGRRGQVRSGAETLIVFIGDSACGASRVKGLPDSFRSLVAAVTADARLSGGTAARVGVAFDWSLEEGARFLHDFGPFDEVQLGGNWISQGATKWIWRDTPGHHALPQVLIVDRVITVGAGGISISNDVVRARLIGSDEILGWRRRVHLAGAGSIASDSGAGAAPRKAGAIP